MSLTWYRSPAHDDRSESIGRAVLDGWQCGGRERASTNAIGKKRGSNPTGKTAQQLGVYRLERKQRHAAAKNEANCRGCLTVDRDDRSKSMVLQNRRKHMQRRDGQSCSPLFLSQPSAGAGIPARMEGRRGSTCTILEVTDSPFAETVRVVFVNSVAGNLMASRDGRRDDTPSSVRACGTFRSARSCRFPGSSRLASMSDEGVH